MARESTDSAMGRPGARPLRAKRLEFITDSPLCGWALPAMPCGWSLGPSRRTEPGSPPTGIVGSSTNARRPSVSAGGASPVSAWRTACLQTPRSPRGCGHVRVPANVPAPSASRFVARLRPGDNWRKSATLAKIGCENRLGGQSALHNGAGRRSCRERCWPLTAGVSPRKRRPESY
jgi:hypothetical protein